MKIGINASRIRSGGGVAHLQGILDHNDPRDQGISGVHVWTHPQLAAALPEKPWLTVHAPEALSRSLLAQLWWERWDLPRALRTERCELLFNIDAGSVCRFRPAVTLSQDMLSYEPGEIDRYGFSRARLRLVALRHVQNASLRNSDGVIFLSAYAGRVIQERAGTCPRVAYIPHGVSTIFSSVMRSRQLSAASPVTCIYVSNIAAYKHQWHVVRAFATLRERGHDVRLELIGGGRGAARRRLDAELEYSDPQRRFVTVHEFVPQTALPPMLAKADVFVFASSCENMPNTLLEAMAAGLPIASSNRGPMPEILKDAGVYFDPEAPETIAAAVETLITDAERRAELSKRARSEASDYSWERCARETFSFLHDAARATSPPQISGR